MEEKYKICHEIREFYFNLIAFRNYSHNHICIFSALIFTMIEAKRDMIDIIQYLGVFAVASFRIVPGASRILTSFLRIRYLEPSVKLLLH